MNVRACTFAIALLCASLLTAHPRAQSAPGRPAPPAGPAPAFSWLAICQGCAGPNLTSWSGLGTATARAEARMTREALVAEDGPCVGGDATCVRRELAKVYRASANCTTGQITAADGETYALAGLWDNTDVGAGRTRWRASGGQLVGRDNASNGLAIAQQWEVLCPGKVSPALLARVAGANGRPAAAGALASAQTPAAAQAAPSLAPARPAVCPGQAFCSEVADFAATVTDFRASLNDPRKVLTVTVRFQNKSDRPLVLGYVPGSGAAIDERNNRYAVYDPDTRGIGLVAANAVDDKFVLAPNQTSDARFTFYWDAGRAVYGTTFGVDFTVREIVPLTNGRQVRLGGEYPLRFAGLGNGARRDSSASPATAPSPACRASAGIPAPSAPVQAAPQVDHCAGSRQACYDAGPFTVTARSVTGTVVGGRHHSVRIDLAFTNQTGQPLVLAYKAATSNAIDNLGNAYVWGRPGTHDVSVQGIGMIEAGRAGTQFRLAPGASANAQFTVIRYNTPTPQASALTFDAVIAELQILPNGTQTETVREYSVHLPDLALAGAGRVGTSPASADDLKKTGQALRKIFKK